MEHHIIYHQTLPHIIIVTTTTLINVFDPSTQTLLNSLPQVFYPFLFVMFPFMIYNVTKKLISIPIMISIEGIIGVNVGLISWWLAFPMILITPLSIFYSMGFETNHNEYGNRVIVRRIYSPSGYDYNEQKAISEELIDMYNYFKEMK